MFNSLMVSLTPHIIQRVELMIIETICGRAFPGFSSDQIRMDQSKPAKRPPINAQRANKLRLANEHKAIWKKERAEARATASEGMAVIAGA
jgi:hypothetical protein